MDELTGIAGEALAGFIERIERLEEDKRNVTDDIREVYNEAKATGFEPKIIRSIVSLRRIDAEKRREQEELIDLYLAAIEGKVE